MRLFAQRGFEGTSIRDVAAEAGVSSSLVVHHFKTKARLREATDARVIALVTETLAELPAGRSDDVDGMSGSFAASLRAEPEMVAYLRRMLVDGGEAARDLFLGLVDATAHELATLESAGLARPSPDPRTRAVLLVVNDLGALVLGDLVQAALGVDPFSQDGLQRWGTVVMDLYANGLFVPPEAPAV